MRRWNDELERREAVRRPTRLPCALAIGTARYDGVLEQVSAGAVVVRIKRAIPPAHEGTLTFATPCGLRFALRALPVRGDVVPRTLRDVLPPSVVLQVREPTDAFRRWVDAPIRGAA
jgi:hypothetical protein